MAMRQLKITNRITNRESTSLANYFSEVNKIPLLKEGEEFELANKVREGDARALEKLVKSNLRFVISVAKQYQNQGIPIEDMINDGNLGLIKAAERFDNTRGFKFISYAVWWIRQSVLQSIAEHSKLIRIPNNQYLSIGKINKAISRLEQEYEREPTAEEIANVLKETDIKVREVLTISTKTVSLDAPVREGEDLNYIDLIPNTSSKRPDAPFYQESMQHDLEVVLNRLNEKQKKILCMYFGLCGYQMMTLEEIGVYFDLTRERARQIKDSALRLLKSRKNSTILRPYFSSDNESGR